ncbi:MAG: hypothetical protein K9M07_07070 [Simkaniaceae bacterium]|nr:hypothetical protein [Simkaniaceae bacterium]MCF7852983.1 hypothetical protein [Simkaniaceae bacterium]
MTSLNPNLGTAFSTSQAFFGMGSSLVVYKDETIAVVSSVFASSIAYIRALYAIEQRFHIGESLLKLCRNPNYSGTIGVLGVTLLSAYAVAPAYLIYLIAKKTLSLLNQHFKSEQTVPEGRVEVDFVRDAQPAENASVARNDLRNDEVYDDDTEGFDADSAELVPRTFEELIQFRTSHLSSQKIRAVSDLMRAISTMTFLSLSSTAGRLDVLDALWGAISAYHIAQNRWLEIEKKFECIPFYCDGMRINAYVIRMKVLVSSGELDQVMSDFREKIESKIFDQFLDRHILFQNESVKSGTTWLGDKAVEGVLQIDPSRCSLMRFPAREVEITADMISDTGRSFPLKIVFNSIPSRLV